MPSYSIPPRPPANEQQRRRRLPVVTNSEFRTFRRCPRERHFAYELGYRPLGEDEALRFGSLFHSGLEAWWRAYADDTVEPLTAAIEAIQPLAVDEFDLVRAGVLLQGYDARWHDADVEVLAVEVEFRTPLVNPLSGAASRTYELAGKLDALIRNTPDGRVYIVEHKTSGDDIGAGSHYWQRLQLDGQISTYYAGARALGYEPAGCLYDVISKPRIAPRLATPSESRKYTKAGALYANQRAEDESPDEYRERLVEAICAEPDRYYQRGLVVRLSDEEREAAYDAWSTARAMREAEVSGVHPRNPDGCERYHRMCGYFAVCTGTASLEDPSLYQRLEHVHPELNASTEGAAE